MRAFAVIVGLCALANFAFSQQKKYNSPSAGNPIIPGYFADPTVKKFGDTWYIYATTDGNGGGFGPSQVWKSKDFVNWTLDDMNWPTTHHYWAPDVTKGNDGKYYMYYCQPVEIFGASANTPTGPWTSLLPSGVPVVKNGFVPDVITLDGQTFRDDDGKFYMFWGTWGIYPNSGCGVGLLNPDMKSFAKTAKIPNTVAKDFFEAPFMFKRNGIYYLTYSSERCEDASYKVRYVMSKTGPMGPFVEGKNNPILVTNADGSVHGPGHQSVLENGKDFYLIYHRHNNPHNNGGYHRQVAADKLEFDADGNIKAIIPSHEGIGYLAKNVNPHTDLAFGKNVEVSSFYSDDFKPEYAVDNNNGSLWKPKNNTSDAWIKIDLGKIQAVKSVHTQFEYATWYYQYVIESSVDGQNWNLFADKSKNNIHGSPMVDVGNVSARFIRLKILNTEYPGLNKAVWNIKVFNNSDYRPQPNTVPGKLVAARPAKGLLVNLDAESLELGSVVTTWNNEGVLKGNFETFSDKKPVVTLIDGRKGLNLNGDVALKSDFIAPETLSGNSSFSVAMWVYNPEVQAEEPIVSWTERGGTDITNAIFGYGSHKQWGAAAHWGWPDMGYRSIPSASKWHHIVFTFDGTYEKIYVDGKLDKQDLKMLFLANLRNFIIGTTTHKNAYFSGSISSLKIYDTALTGDEVFAQANEKSKSKVAIYLDANKLLYGDLNEWKNQGFESGAFTTTTLAPNVTDIAGRLAVWFNGKSSLSFPQNLGNSKDVFTVNLTFNTTSSKKGNLVSWLNGNNEPVGIAVPPGFSDGKWHQLICTYANSSYQVYVDGKPLGVKPISTKQAGAQLILGDGFNGAISSFAINTEEIGAIKVAEMFANWINTFPKNGVQKAQFAIKPQAVSPQMITMQAAPVNLPGAELSYFYSSQLQGSKEVDEKWLESPLNVETGKTAEAKYVYKTKLKDNFGNVTQVSDAVIVSTQSSLFKIQADLFAKSADLYLVKPETLGWDGFTGIASKAEIKDNALTLASENTTWDGSGDRSGPFLFKEIKGDFIAEVEVADLIGLTDKKVNGANEGGIMILSKNNSAQLIQSGIMPAWSVGNIVTEMTQGYRKQLNNQAGWQFYKHLQIQRSADTYYIRGSNDGKQWHPLVVNPVTLPLGETVKVGLYHATYGKNAGWYTFKNFRIVQINQ